MTDSNPPARAAGRSHTGDRGAADQPDERNTCLTLHRVVNAPVETVHAAWTDPEVLRRWLAPGNALKTPAMGALNTPAAV